MSRNLSSTHPTRPRLKSSTFVGEEDEKIHLISLLQTDPNQSFWSRMKYLSPDIHYVYMILLSKVKYYFMFYFFVL